MTRQLLASLLLLVAQAAMATCSRPMNMAIEEWPPYIYTDARHQPAGLDIELAQAIFREADCILQIQKEVPGKRRLLLHQQGAISVLLAASLTAERQQQSWFTLPYRNEITGLVSLPTLAEQAQGIRNFAELAERGLHLLSPVQGWYGQDYANEQPRLKSAGLLSHYETIDQGIRMLQAERGAVLMADLAAIQWQARQLGLTLQVLPYTPVRDKVHMMLSKKSTTLQDVKTLNAAIGRLEANGTLERIRRNYGLR